MQFPTSPVKKVTIMNRDIVKYIAITAMACNHFALVFLQPDMVLYEILVDIGYFTAVTMCYFLVEGYYCTRDRKKYGKRLLVFGLLSQIPYRLAFPYSQLNMLFTLYICYHIVQVMDSKRSEYEKNWMVFLLSSLTIFSDWALMAPLFTILFVKSRGNKRETGKAFLMSAFAFAGINLLSFMMNHPPGEAILRAVCSGLGILAAGFVITYCYNGRQAVRGRTFSKWFFYIFYPAHILMFWVIKVMM